MVNRSKGMTSASESELDDESGHSDSDDSSFVPSKSPSQNGTSAGRVTRNTRHSQTDKGRRTQPKGRKRQRSPVDPSSDCQDLVLYRNTKRPTHQQQQQQQQSEQEEEEEEEEEEESEVAVPHQQRYGRRRRQRRSTRQSECDDSDDDDREEPIRQIRNNAKVVEAVWTPEKTVRITYNQGVRHACMNPVHGKAKTSYRVLHLVTCTWKYNVKLMKEVPSTAKAKLYQYSHKICQACMDKYGPHCFKCDPSDGNIVPKLDTVFGEEAITSVEDFRDAVRKWQYRRDDIEASYLVLHCTVIGPEARVLRRKFDLKRWTTVHIVYSDVRDRMEPAGSGLNLEDSTVFQNIWKTVMMEKVHYQDQPLISFFGNILLNDGVTFEDFKVNDLLLMYQPNVFTPLESDVMRVSINTLSLQVPAVEVAPSDCCLRNAVVHVHREARTLEDDGLFQHGNLVADVFYKGAKRHFGNKICAEFEQRAMLGEQLKIGEEGHKLPFRKLFVARGGEVQFRRVANATQDVPRMGGGDLRSRVCSVDTSGYELVCWTSRGAPGGGDFVIPGLMYKFEIISSSALVFRPQRYFHATLPASNRDLKNEKFAASFVTTT